MIKNGRLTQKQEVFCLKYLELGNATQAALIAGYSSRSARFLASRLITKANIQLRIKELRSVAEDATIAEDAFIDSVEFLAAEAFQIAAAGTFYYDISGLILPYVDQDFTQELHLSLQPTSGAKPVDDVVQIRLELEDVT